MSAIKNFFTGENSVTPPEPDIGLLMTKVARTITHQAFYEHTTSDTTIELNQSVNMACSEYDECLDTCKRSLRDPKSIKDCVSEKCSVYEGGEGGHINKKWMDFLKQKVGASTSCVDYELQSKEAMKDLNVVRSKKQIEESLEACRGAICKASNINISQTASYTGSTADIFRSMVGASKIGNFKKVVDSAMQEQYAKEKSMYPRFVSMLYGAMDTDGAISVHGRMKQIYDTFYRAVNNVAVAKLDEMSGNQSFNIFSGVHVKHINMKQAAEVVSKAWTKSTVAQKLIGDYAGEIYQAAFEQINAQDRVLHKVEMGVFFGGIGMLIIIIIVIIVKAVKKKKST